MKGLQIFLILLVGLSKAAYTQNNIVDDASAEKIISQCATRFPKFYKAFNEAKAQDKLINKFVFVRSNRQNSGPAFASPLGNIRIDVQYLETQQPRFDDDRLVVVLYHEIGHLHYYKNTPPEQRTSDDSEQAAFEYSLIKTKEMAEQGDCGPLKSGLRFMLMRSQGTNLQDPHVKALKKIVRQPLYESFVKYAADSCP